MKRSSMLTTNNSDQDPKISIIIPTYNRAVMLMEAINSVLNQDYENWELIIVDNFSTDETDKLIGELSDVRIRYIKTPRTGSVAASRNLGISMATGNWVAFLDSDDLWAPTKLSTVIPIMELGYELIFHALIIMNEKNPKVRYRAPQRIRIKSPIYFNLLLNGNVISLSSVVLKKIYLDTIGGMNESKELYALEDYDAWLRISRLTENFFYIRKFLGSYRVHDSNISQGNNFAYVTRGLESHLKSLSRNQRRRFDGLYIYKEVAHQIKERDFSHIIKKLFFAIRYAPLKYSIRLLIQLPQALMASVFTK